MIKELKKKTIFYKDYQIINFINLSNIEKNMILDWRNDFEVRYWMLSKHIISLKDHLSYINDLKKKQDKLCFLVQKNDFYLGIIEFDNIAIFEACFGINKNIYLKRKGIGVELGEIGIYIAKKLLKLKILKLYVFKENLRAIKLYKKLNFKQFLLKENKIYMKKIL